MEINVKEILSRLDLQHIRDFAFEEVPDSVYVHNETYNERLKQGKELMINRLKNICRNAEELNDVTDDFFESMATYSKVYAEIGMKIGARLLFQLLVKDD